MDVYRLAETQAVLEGPSPGLALHLLEVPHAHGAAHAGVEVPAHPQAGVEGFRPEENRRR